MKIDSDKFKEFVRKSGLMIDISYTNWATDEIRYMNLNIKGNQEEVTKAIDILLTYWDVREKRKEPKHDLRKFRKNI